MEKKTASAIMLALLLTSMLTLAFNVQPVKAEGTIYIRADGSVEGTTSIHTADNVTYAFTANINDSIIVERNNIIIDGNGHTLQGPGNANGIDLSGRTNVTVQNTTIKAFSWGIWLYSSSSNTISGNNITNNYDGIRLSVSSSNTISSNNITANNYDGIYLYYSSSNTVSSNNITANNWDGIWLYSSLSNSISGNNITANYDDGIRLSYSSNSMISGNNITANNYYGIYLDDSSSFNSMSGNDITNNSEDGIVLYDSSNYNSMSGNNITNNSYYGIRLGSSSNYNSIIGNNITNNWPAGILLHDSSSFNSIIGNNITNNSDYCIWLYDSKNNSINGNKLTDGGLAVWDSYSNSVENNTVNGRPLVYLEGVADYSVDDAGQVVLVRCDRIRVEDLNLSRTSNGVQLWETNNSIISGNKITANTVYGVELFSSSNNSMSGNDITNNSGNGISLDSSSNHNSINRNNITNNSVWGILLSDSSSFNSINGNNITNNSWDGIWLYSSSNYNSIIGNNITNNSDYGVGLYDSSNYNSIIGNNITNNGFYGVYLDSSSNNKFYHNNFIYNGVQVYSEDSANVWDDGYPSGGNYWSDYFGVDIKSGPGQDLPGSDGIGDTPYVIDANNVDHYPLMSTYGAPPLPTYTLTITTTVGGTTDPAPGTYSYTANSTVQVTAIPEANYLFDYWELDGVNVGSANPYSVLMDKNHTLKAVFSLIPPPLSASISPLSASILAGQSVTFTPTVSGGYTPYSYQWYLNGAPVSEATSNTWTFTPTTSGIYYVHLKVTDDKGNTAQSETARITVATVPVGGYSIPIQVHTKTEPIIPYIALIATLTAVFTKLRPKTKRKR